MAATGPSEPSAEPALRPAIAEDALCLSVLAMQVFLDTYATRGIRPAIAREVLRSYSERSFTEAIADPGTRLVIAEHDHHLIGFAQLTLRAAHELHRAERLAVADGASVLWLTPWVHNHRALAFYARRGYTDHGLTWFETEGEPHENRVLAKAVGVA